MIYPTPLQYDSLVLPDTTQTILHIHPKLVHRLSQPHLPTSAYKMANIRVHTILHSVGFEPTSTNTFELESNPLDRSGKNAMILT